MKTDVAAKPTFLNKFGGALEKSGALEEATRISSELSPELATAFQRIFDSKKGPLIAKAYSTYAELGKQPKFAAEVRQALTKMATTIGGASEAKAKEFVDRVLNDTKALTKEVTVKMKDMSPNDLQTALTANVKSAAEARRNEAASLAQVA